VRVRRADDVVIEVGFHVPARLRQGLRVVIGPKEPLFLAVETREDQRLRKVETRQQSRRFEHGGHARAIVVGAGRIEDRIVAVGVARVVMTRDHDDAARRIVAGQRRDDARDQDVARRAFRLRLHVLVERHAEPAAVRL
jgi:hypothetical protein